MVSMYTPLYLKWITNRELLYSTWNSAQGYLKAWMGGESGGEWIDVYVWLRPFTVPLKLPQHCYSAISSIQFSCSVVSDSLQPHELQHARPPRLTPTPGVYSDSCPSSRWRHPAISSSVVPFSSCPQSFPASGSFPTSLIYSNIK